MQLKTCYINANEVLLLGLKYQHNFSCSSACTVSCCCARVSIINVTVGIWYTMSPRWENRLLYCNVCPLSGLYQELECSYTHSTVHIYLLMNPHRLVCIKWHMHKHTCPYLHTHVELQGKKLRVCTQVMCNVNTGLGATGEEDQHSVCSLRYGLEMWKHRYALKKTLRVESCRVSQVQVCLNLKWSENTLSFASSFSPRQFVVRCCAVELCFWLFKKRSCITVTSYDTLLCTQLCLVVVLMFSHTHLRSPGVSRAELHDQDCGRSRPYWWAVIRAHQFWECAVTLSYNTRTASYCEWTSDFWMNCGAPKINKTGGSDMGRAALGQKQWRKKQVFSLYRDIQAHHSLEVVFVHAADKERLNLHLVHCHCDSPQMLGIQNAIWSYTEYYRRPSGDKLWFRLYFLNYIFLMHKYVAVRHVSIAIQKNVIEASLVLRHLEHLNLIPVLLNTRDAAVISNRKFWVLKPLWQQVSTVLKCLWSQPWILTSPRGDIPRSSCLCNLTSSCSWLMKTTNSFFRESIEYQKHA